jgi:ribosomal protein S6
VPLFISLSSYFNVVVMVVVVVVGGRALGGWVRAVENHGVRPLPYRIKSRYSPEGERFQDAARFTSLYFDAPVKTKADVEQALALNEQVLRTSFFRPKSVVDEVRTSSARAPTTHRPPHPNNNGRSETVIACRWHAFLLVCARDADRLHTAFPGHVCGLGMSF